MNCKPGDLAVITSPYGQSSMLGLVVTVVRQALRFDGATAKNGEQSRNFDGSVSWICEGHDANLPAAINDRCLRPIRDPGEDATDETLEWLPVPRETETMP